MVLFDTHCHLDFTAFDADRDATLARARAADVAGLVLIGIDPDSWRRTTRLSRELGSCWRTVGIHPNSVQNDWNAGTREQMCNELASADVVGVGETGIDLFRSSESLNCQVEAFEVHLDIARKMDLPVVIHQRNAEAEVLDVVRNAGGAKGIMHCFEGDWRFALRCLDLGLTLGIGGVATYKRSTQTREAIARIPADRYVLETDAPFLAPQSRRGDRNEPAFLTEIAEVVAHCRSQSVDAIAEESTANACSLFGVTLDGPIAE